MNEKQLIQRCKENSYSAQLTVYNLYKDMMYNVSYRIVKSREDAEDIIQESFIKAFEKIGQIKEELSLGSWLKKIVINASLDAIRKRKREYWVEETQIADEETEELELDEYSEISVELIKKCINNLKEKYRVILVLYMIEDYNHREISELLNLKESTVRNQYRRGKNMLVESIQNIRKNEFKRLHTGS
ncbi:RNA polymerase sigma factor [Pseudotenacibaculum sp. MALMAid0570]|uniref:RNA polymerase sigma factor n=1 Tax=Pseudotenacibaculum sp. MALMAid0570 TaxID=3143938 RepID=UPI0032DECA94